MKQISLVAAMLCATIMASAQETPQKETVPPQITPPANVITDMNSPAVTAETKKPVDVSLIRRKENTNALAGNDKLTMFGNQLYITREGRSELVSSDLTLDDGMLISSNGTIKTAAGKTIKLKNGQHYPGKLPGKKNN